MERHDRHLAELLEPALTMTFLSRTRRTITAGIPAVVAALFALAPGEACAELEGRVGITNLYSQVSGPDATFDAALLRIWLRNERIGGRNISFVVDARSDLPLLASAAKGFENGKVFNEQCRGDADQTPHPGCADIPIREQRVGQLLHLAGIYDAYVMFGELSAGRGAFSVGRKTIYEAGLSSVDGLVYERQMDRARWGVFGGLAPDPLTRMFSVKHQATGAYYAFRHDRAWIRLGAFAQLYEGAPDRITLHNHDFWAITNSLRLAAILQYDVVPAQDRLVHVDLTYRPSGRYRVRASVMRFRPYDFAESPSHLIQPPEDALIDDFRSATRGTTPVASVLRGRFGYRNPEVLEVDLRTSAINQVKLVGHYTTATSITPFVSVAFRTREIDGAGALLVGGGLYAYDLLNLGIVGRLRVDYVAGFTNDHNRITLDVEQRLSDTLAFGGGFLVGTVEYHGRDRVVNAGYGPSSTVTGFSARVRNDRMTGLSLFAQADYIVENRNMGNQADDARQAEASSTTMTGMLGVSWRF